MRSGHGCLSTDQTCRPFRCVPRLRSRARFCLTGDRQVKVVRASQRHTCGLQLGQLSPEGGHLGPLGLARGWRKLQSGTLYGKLSCRPELDRSDNPHPAVINLLENCVTECFDWLHLLAGFLHPTSAVCLPQVTSWLWQSHLLTSHVPRGSTPRCVNNSQTISQVQAILATITAGHAGLIAVGDCYIALQMYCLASKSANNRGLVAVSDKS